jgi:hypothetical protein
VVFPARICGNLGGGISQDRREGTRKFEPFATRGNQNSASSSNRKGSIFLENTSGLEAAARIVPEGTRAGGRVLHINPNQRLPVQGIPAGKYSVYYSTGRNWDEGKKKFISQAMYSKSSIAMPSGRKWDVPVYLYHPEDPERRSSSAEEFSE